MKRPQIKFQEGGQEFIERLIEHINKLEKIIKEHVHPRHWKEGR